MGLQRVRRDWATELNWEPYKEKDKEWNTRNTKRDPGLNAFKMKKAIIPHNQGGWQAQTGEVRKNTRPRHITLQI